MVNDSEIEKILNIKNDRKFRIVCESTLQLIGCGTTRTVYKLNDTLVLKVANRKYGYIQNISEYDVFCKYKNLKIFANIFNKDDNGLWIIQSLATPLNINDNDFKQILKVVNHVETSKHYYSNNLFLNNLYTFLKTININYLHDFKKCDSYGKINNELCIIDYSMNNEDFDNKLK